MNNPFLAEELAAHAQQMYDAEKLGAALKSIQRALAEGGFVDAWSDLEQTIKAEMRAAEKVVPTVRPQLVVHAGRQPRIDILQQCLLAAANVVQERLDFQPTRPVVLAWLDAVQVQWIRAKFGYYAPKTEIDKIAIVASDRHDLEAGVRHEMGHVALTWLSAGRAPSWLQEGVCTLLEGDWEETSERMELDRADNLLTSWQHVMGEPIVDRAYDAAASFVHFLVERRGWPAIRDYLRRLKQGQWDVLAFPASFGATRSQLERRWRG